MSDDVLYHYTTAAGFLGIVRQQRIRATNFSFLNDSSEVAYGVKLVAECVKQFSTFFDVTSENFDSDRIIAGLKSFRDLNDLYVSCFTSLRDDLSQWRGYGETEADRYCLGIQRDCLTNLRAPAPIVANVQLVKLIYDAAMQRDIIASVLTRQKREPRAWHELVLHLSHLTLRFKTPAFAAEDEWRIAVSTLGSACEVAEFVVSNGRVRPYIELVPTSSGLDIRDVVVLPGANSVQAFKAAQLVMERHGYEPSIVHLSEIPFVG